MPSNPTGSFCQVLDVEPIMANSAPSLHWSIADENGSPITLTGKTMALVVSTDLGSSLLKLWEHKTTDLVNPFTIVGSALTIALTSADTATPGGYQYVLWDVGNLVPLARGLFPIVSALSP